ncbi:hypothetical protein SM11_chr0027 [Sinorhizobium meliloti SM11]|uniref:Uncharacterized protein n=1 Tax=Sinorhizobium meliloti (strain SM11) TaxID=707241 RepID=F7X5U7_SINMM|nr:hypothetical protein SM11_chr0027 [Sinorhizobium meliloti SM11]
MFSFMVQYASVMKIRGAAIDNQDTGEEKRPASAP